MKQINGDEPSNIFTKLLYFYQCIKNHRKGTDESCKIYSPTLTISNLNTFDKSPPRLLSDALFNSIDYENLKLQLNSNLNFFDIGCGSGKYGTLLKKISNKFFGNYTGLDLYKNKEYPPEFNHINDTAENCFKYIDSKINFVLSHSALEHMEKDIIIIDEITKKLNENNTNFIQIHIVPASKSLWLYLLHGYRQYSKKNLSYISSQLKKKYDVDTSIIPLGGKSSFWLHLRYITLPYYFRKWILKDKIFKWSDQKDIEKKIIKSVNSELNCKNQNPIFWAFIINSKNIKIKDKLFKNFY